MWKYPRGVNGLFLDLLAFAIDTAIDALFWLYTFEYMSQFLLSGGDAARVIADQAVDLKMGYPLFLEGFISLLQKLQDQRHAHKLAV